MYTEHVHFPGKNESSAAGRSASFPSDKMIAPQDIAQAALLPFRMTPNACPVCFAGHVCRFCAQATSAHPCLYCGRTRMLRTAGVLLVLGGVLTVLVLA